jgi:hypothetical protein
MINIDDLSFSSNSIDDVFTNRQASAPAAPTNPRVRVASAIPVGFVKVADDQLVRISQQDFWRIGFDNEGYFIERLVDDNDPVKG